MVEVHGSRCAIQVDFDALIGDPYRPKHAIGRDAGVEVVDLIGRDNLSLIEVQSNKTEGAGVLLSIDPDVDTLHETHVHVEQQGVLFAGARVDAHPSPSEGRNTNEALEVEDRRIFGGGSRRRWIGMEKLSKGRETFGNGFRSGTVILCQRQPWHPKS